MHKYLLFSMFCVAAVISSSAQADLVINPFPNAETEAEAPDESALEPPVEDIAFDGEVEATLDEMDDAVEELVKKAEEAKEAAEQAEQASQEDILQKVGEVELTPAPEPDKEDSVAESASVEKSEAPKPAHIRPAPRAQTAKKQIRPGPTGLTSFDIEKYYAQFAKGSVAQQAVTPPPQTTMVENPQSTVPTPAHVTQSVEDYYARYARPSAGASVAADFALTPTPSTPAAPHAPSPTPLTASTQVLAGKNWQASQGYSLKHVLSAWSQQEGVELLWRADGDFSVPQSLHIQASYESAVESLLKPYINKTKRPVGSLYIDPSSGSRVLVVEGL